MSHLGGKHESPGRRIIFSREPILVKIHLCLSEGDGKVLEEFRVRKTLGEIHSGIKNSHGLDCLGFKIKSPG